MKRLRAIRAVGMTLTVIILAFTGVLFFLVYGVPLHDFRLWRLEKNYNVAVLYHPPESILLQKKKYLGGPYTHGSLTCDYFVGELRAAPLSKEKIRQTYNGHFIASFGILKRIPLNVLFFDEDHWTMNSPLGDWWDEWYQNPLFATSSTVYFVYASQEGYPFLGDMRCDD